MSTTKKTGRTKKHRVGWIAIGYSEYDNFWYSSEGVFNSAKTAIEDITNNYEVNKKDCQAIKVNLTR